MDFCRDAASAAAEQSESFPAYLQRKRATARAASASENEDSVFTQLSSACGSLFFLDLGCFFEASYTGAEQKHDEDAGEVFENLIHLQKHRRGRALLQAFSFFLCNFVQFALGFF